VKLHDLRPVPGSRRERTRVGRGIAAGKGKTAGRGTKGQKSRTGASIPAWFEGGQTPIHMRVPKLHGFKNRFRTEYAIVNLGRIEAALETKRLEPGPKGAPATVNAELLHAAGLVGRLDRPLKVLGTGELNHKIMAVADAFSAEARRKIEAAGGSVMVLEVPGAAPKKPKPTKPAEADASTAEARGERKAPAEAEPVATTQGEATAATSETASAEPIETTAAAREPAQAQGAAIDSAAPESAAAETPATKPSRSRTKATAKGEPSTTTTAEPTAKPRRTRKAPDQTA
jgi:large subunit ribosomal protein L15